MSSSNKVLAGVSALLLIAVVAMGVLVFQRLSASDEQPASAAPVESSSEAVVSPSVSASAQASRDSYALADGTCKTAEGVDFSDSSAVAERFVEISFCFDSMVDSTMTAGMLRADGLMTDELSSKLVEPERNGLQDQWVLAQEHEAYTRPTVSEAATEPLVDPSGELKHESKRVQWLWVGRDGASMDGGYATLDIALVNQGGRWLVNDVQTGVFEAK